MAGSNHQDVPDIVWAVVMIINVVIQLKRAVTRIATVVTFKLQLFHWRFIVLSVTPLDYTRTRLWFCNFWVFAVFVFTHSFFACLFVVTLVTFGLLTIMCILVVTFQMILKSYITLLL